MDYKDWWFRTLDTLGFWGGINSLFNNNVEVDEIKENMASNVALAPYTKNTVATSDTQKFDHPAIVQIQGHLEEIKFTGESNSVVNNGFNNQSVLTISGAGSRLANNGLLVGGFADRPFQTTTQSYRTMEGPLATEERRSVWNWWPVTRAVSVVNPNIWYNGMLAQISSEQVGYYQRKNNSRVIKIRHWMTNKKGQVYPNTRAKSQDGIRRTNGIIPADPTMSSFGDFSNYWQMAYGSNEITAEEYDQGSDLIRNIFGEEYTGTQNSLNELMRTGNTASLAEGFNSFREWVKDNGGSKNTVVLSTDKTFNNNIPDWIRTSELTYREMGEIWDMLQMTQVLFYLYGHSESNRDKIKARMNASILKYENFGTVTGEKIQDVINFAPWRKLQNIMKYTYFGDGRTLMASRFGSLSTTSSNNIGKQPLTQLPIVKLEPSTSTGEMEWKYNTDYVSQQLFLNKGVIVQSISSNIDLNTGAQSQNLTPNKAMIEFFEPSENHTIFTLQDDEVVLSDALFDPDSNQLNPNFVKLKRLPEGRSPYGKTEGENDPMVAWHKELMELTEESGNNNTVSRMVSRGTLLKNITLGWIMENLDWTRPRTVHSDNRYGSAEWQNIAEVGQNTLDALPPDSPQTLANIQKIASKILLKFGNTLNFQNSQWLPMGLIRINNECIMDKPLAETCSTLEKYQELSGNDSLIYTYNNTGDYWMSLNTPRRMSSQDSIISYDWFRPTATGEDGYAEGVDEMMVSGTNEVVQKWGWFSCPFNLIDKEGTFWYTGPANYYEKNDSSGAKSKQNYLGFPASKSTRDTTNTTKANHKRQNPMIHGGSTLIPTPESINDTEFWADYIQFRQNNLRIKSEVGTASLDEEIPQQQWVDSECPQYLLNNLKAAGDRNEYGDLTGDAFFLGYEGWLQQRKNITPVVTAKLETWFLTGNNQSATTTVNVVNKYLTQLHNAQKYDTTPRHMKNYLRNTIVPESQYQKFVEGQKPAFLEDTQNFMRYAVWGQYRNTNNSLSATALQDDNIEESFGFTWAQFWEDDMPEKYGDMAKIYQQCVQDMAGERHSSSLSPSTSGGGFIPHQYHFAKIMLDDDRNSEEFFAENKKYQFNARATILPATENELKNQPFSIRGLRRLNPYKFLINWCRKLKARVKNLLV